MSNSKFYRRFLSQACSVFLLLALGNVAAQAQGSLSLSLEQAITQTMVRNPQLQTLGYAMRAQDGRILQAGLSPRPELNVTVENAFGTGVAQGLSQAQATVSIAWVLEGDLKQRRIDVARIGSEALADEAQRTRLDAAAQTARYYTRALEQLLHRDIADAALTLAQEAVTAVEERVSAGSTLSAELARAQAELAKRELFREDVDHEMTTANHLLAAQWGDLTPAFNELEGAPLSLPAIEPFDVLLARLEQNPDLSKYFTQTRLRESILRLEQANARSPWSVSTGIRRIQGSADFGLVAEVNIPLGLGNNNQGSIAQARENLSQTAVEREAVMISLQTRLLGIYLDLEHSLHRATTLKDAVIPRYEEALTEIRRAYDLGSASYLDRLQVQEELLAARSDLAETSIQAHLDIIEIERITGVRIAQLSPIQRGTP